MDSDPFNGLRKDAIFKEPDRKFTKTPFTGMDCDSPIMNSGIQGVCNLLQPLPSKEYAKGFLIPTVDQLPKPVLRKPTLPCKAYRKGSLIQTVDGLPKLALKGLDGVGFERTGLTLLLKRKRGWGDESTWELEVNKKPKVKEAEEKEWRVPPVVASKPMEARIKERGGKDIKWVLLKKLTKTDLDSHQGRF